MQNDLKEFINPHAWRTAFFLAIRYLTRTSPWQTGLVIGVMTLTFLNVVVVSGILVGLMDGSLIGFKENYSGDVLISKLPEREHIERTTAIVSMLETSPFVDVYTPRKVESAFLEANFQKSIAFPNLVPDRIGVPVVGIDVVREESVTGIAQKIIEGSFLSPSDERGIVLGARLLERHFPAGAGLQTISNVYPGDKVRLIFDGPSGSVSREYTVRGVIKAKAGPADSRVFMNIQELENVTRTLSTNIDEIAVRLTPGVSATYMQQDFSARGFETAGIIRTAEEVLGEFLDQIRDTFSVIGNIIGIISVIVASVTVFIIIFITAITRRKFIGILKAIGVSSATIELSYVMLSVWYALAGVGIGIAILTLILVPYIDAHPIDFPFSDGVLSASVEGTLIRAGLIIFATLCAGFIPARMIVQKNTLDSILGR